MPAQLRRRRQRSIRVLLTLIFIVPLVSLLGLWGFAASVTVSNAVQEHNFQSEDSRYGGWAQALFGALATEREQAFIYLTSGRHVPIAPYLAAQQATNKAAQALEQGLNTGLSSFVPAARTALVSFKKEIAWLASQPGLPGIRPGVAAGSISALTAFQDYNAIIDSEFQLYSELVVVNNTSLYMQAAASVQAGQSIEMASREATLLSAIVYAHGQMTKDERVLFAQTVATRQVLLNNALRQLDPSIGSGYQRVLGSAAYKSFTGLESIVVNSVGNSRPLAISPLQIAAATLPMFNGFQSAEKQNRLALSALGTSVGNQLLEEVGLAGGAGLLAVALSIFLMVRFGRRISRELTGLQRAALNLAEDRLPRVVSRLSEGEEIDIAAEAAPLTPGRIAETARVAEAFSSVQRTAVEAAVGQARLRRGVSQVFRNLAWRSQSLLHRQLSLLDAMERRQTEPETLDELFQLDHLTTRMRRHAEGLIILSGAAPGRGWREPVPIVDVLRGAIAEVEDYKRVTVLCDSPDAVVGTAVADVIHLMAELVENATTFSPASTEVTIRAERVANGFVAEIEDRGIGIGPEDLATFNERLANPPEFDLADSNQLGLFVVARLAGKHRIMVTLRRSPFGGTTAIVLMPNAIVSIRDRGDAEALEGFRRELSASGRVLAGNGQPGGGSPDNGLAIPAEQSPALAVGRLAPYLPEVDDSAPDRPADSGLILGSVAYSGALTDDAATAASATNGAFSEPASTAGGEAARAASPAPAFDWNVVGTSDSNQGGAVTEAGSVTAAAEGSETAAEPAGNGSAGPPPGLPPLPRRTAGSSWDASVAPWEGTAPLDRQPGASSWDRGSRPTARDRSPSSSAWDRNSRTSAWDRSSAASGWEGSSSTTASVRPAAPSAWDLSGAAARPEGAGNGAGAVADGNGTADGNGSADGNGTTDGTAPPWLPRRQRQASLAPQLKNDAADSVSERQGDDGFDSPSPAGSRALVESLQFALDRAAATPTDESWPVAESTEPAAAPEDAEEL